MATAYENVALWHERDISHSATERIILPDATELLDYMLNRMMNILGNLTVFEDKMKADIYMTNGVIFAQRVMNALIGKGFAREKAYDTVQPVAMRAMATGMPYIDLLREDPTVSATLSNEELEACFTLDYYMKNVDYIYKRNKIED
jgi:adenylosuccinate lyase